jgi:predicted phage replisome organizer
MSKSKRYYWLKLREDFLNGKTVDYLLSMTNGSEYLAIYLKLCMLTINRNGELSYVVGNKSNGKATVIQYDEQMLQRDLKFFKLETIAIAMKIFQSFGLVSETENGFMIITDYEKLVGSETNKAEYMRNSRANAITFNEGNIVTPDVTPDVTPKIKGNKKV